MYPTPNDFGPIYAETLPGLLGGDLIVEPWNTVSNLIFLAIGIRMASRTQLSLKRHPLVVSALPILLTGWLGGTVYHATRSHSLWLIMDFVPIILLTTSAAIVFWKRVVDSWTLGVFLFVITAASGRFLSSLFTFERSITISLGYVSSVLALLIPITILVRRENWRGVLLLGATVISFAIAVLCRLLDRPGIEPILPMGTHFLWHLFGGISVWCLMELIVTLDMLGSSPRIDKTG
jgi:hypothetical protein